MSSTREQAEGLTEMLGMIAQAVQIVGTPHADAGRTVAAWNGARNTIRAAHAGESDRQWALGAALQFITDSYADAIIEGRACTLLDLAELCTQEGCRILLAAFEADEDWAVREVEGVRAAAATDPDIYQLAFENGLL